MPDNMIRPAKKHLPLSLEICPIVDAVVEIRFTTDIIPQAVFGVAYEKLKKDYPRVENLPILQLPQVLIEKDPNLQNKPHYKLYGDNFSVQIGPNLISVSPLFLANDYPGWHDYSREIFEVFTVLSDSGIVSSVTRLGIRYTNFFERMDIFKKINLLISYNKEVIPYRKTLLRTELEVDNFINTLQLSNDATQQLPSGLRYGSIIDVDTYREYPSPNNFTEIFRNEINHGHDIEKQIFWDLLNDEFKSELRPTFQ